LKNLFKLFSLLSIIFTLARAGCSDDGDSKITADPNDSEAPLSAHDPLFEGAPTNDELPEDGKFDAVYPETFDLADSQSPMRSQGGRGVCSIFATVALMEHLYIKEGTIVDPDFSEQFLQWSVKNEVNSFPNTAGSNANYNLQAINRYGIVLEDIWPYESRRWSSSNDERCDGGDEQPLVCYTNGDPDPEALEADRWTLPRGRYVNSRNRSIKAFLTENKQGVIAGMTFFYQSWNHGASKLPVNKDYWSEGYVLYPNEADKEKSLENRAGHAILIIGWDDNLEVPKLDGEGNVIKDENGEPVTEKGFFLFKNSWGTGGFGIRNKFGDGYGWLSYEYVREYATVYGAGIPEVASDEVCDDGIDNDKDGDVDCVDSDCTEDPACKPGLKFSDEPQVDIPDNDSQGISSVINVDQPGTVGKLYVKVDIDHTYIGDLQIRLLGPDGTEAVLHDKEGSSEDNIKQTYLITDFDGKSIAGEWTLTVIDTANSDTGTLNSWSLEFQLTGDIPAEVCDDGIDNNGNGDLDCADAECGSDPVCQTAQDIDLTNEANAEIPDNDLEGLQSTIAVETVGTIESLTISVDITHTFRPDLLVKLVSPSGTEVVLYDLEEYEENLIRSFNVPEFIGTEIEGNWTLVVVDQYEGDLGTLNSWSLAATVQ
jgi:subtilisin-like proprotein convertase family protein